MDNHTSNLIDFPEEKYSQAGVIVRDYHMVSKKEKDLYGRSQTVYHMICDNTVRCVCGGGGLPDSNLINFTNKKDGQVGLINSDDHERKKIFFTDDNTF